MGICASPAACRMRAEMGERGNGRCRSRQAVVASAVVASCSGVIEAPLAATDVATGERCRRRPRRSGKGGLYCGGWRMRASRAVDANGGERGRGPMLWLAARLEGLDNDHASTAGRARGDKRIRGSIWDGRLLARLLRNMAQQVADRGEVLLSGGAGEQTVVADAVSALALFVVVRPRSSSF